MSGAGEESRTLDLNLGKVALYQLSYSRVVRRAQEPGCEGRKYSGPFLRRARQVRTSRFELFAGDKDAATPINA